MDEIWERAVEAALAGETEPETTRILTLDGAVKCVKGHLPRPEILEKFQNLEHLSIASIGVSSLDQFPRLGKLQKLVLSDNRIAGGLEFLVQAGLGLLCDLDLSNNRIQLIEDLVPLAQLKLVSLDLYQCPVTQMKDYRSKVFGLVKSLKYLDKMDAEEENERPESEDDEIGGEERPNVMSNGHSERLEGVDEEENEADEEETETGRQSDGVSDHANGLRDEHLNIDEEVNDDSDEEDVENEYEPDGFLVDDTRDIDEEEVGEGDEEVDLGVPPRNFLQRDINGELDDSDEEDVENEYEPDGFLVDDTLDLDEEDVGEGEEEVDLGVPHGNEFLRNIITGEINRHEQDEDDGESWEEEEEEEDGEEDEEHGAGGLIQHVAEAIQVDEEEEYEDDEVVCSIASSNLKRKRDEDDDVTSSSSDNNDEEGSIQDVLSDDDDE